MKVIFTQNHGSARVDDIKDVKDGYARFLLRYEIADIATPDLVAEAEARQAEKVKQLEKDQAAAQKVADELGEVVLEFTEKANEEGHLFGSVAEAQIAESFISAAKVEVTKDQVHMAGHIKEAGEHMVKVQLVKGVNVEVKVVVTAAE